MITEFLRYLNAPDKIIKKAPSAGLFEGQTDEQEMGVSYSEYLRSVRLKSAVTLLDHGIDSVKNVALLSGFSDPLYFSKVFKDSIGISPSGYTKNKQQGK